jgi:hypothetical protein
MNATAQVAESILPRLQQELSGACLVIPDDLEMIENECVQNAQDELDYLWFHVIEYEGGQRYQEYCAVRLMHLASISLEVYGLIVTYSDITDRKKMVDVLYGITYRVKITEQWALPVVQLFITR